MRVVLICAAVSLLAACSNEPSKDVVARARAVVSKDFPDPYSAVFENLYLANKDKGYAILCGTVNAKNLLGAYTGRRKFVYFDEPGKPDAAIDGSGSELPEVFCTRPA